MNNSLMKNFNGTHTDLSELIRIMAKNVENSLLSAGAVAGKDYTILDLYKLAQPFALSVFEKPQNNVSFQTSF
jgi:hypothetical protein